LPAIVPDKMQSVFRACRVSWRLCCERVFRIRGKRFRTKPFFFSGYCPDCRCPADLRRTADDSGGVPWTTLSDEPPIPYVRHGRGNLITAEAGRKKPCGWTCVQPQGLVFVCNDREGGSLQAALGSVVLPHRPLAGRNVSAYAGSLLPFSLLRNLLLLSGGRRIAHDVGRRSGKTV